MVQVQTYARANTMSDAYAPQGESYQDWVARKQREAKRQQDIKLAESALSKGINYTQGQFPDSSGVQGGGNAALGGLQLYNGLQQWNNGNKVGGAINIGMGGYNAATGVQSALAGSGGQAAGDAFFNTAGEVPAGLLASEGAGAGASGAGAGASAAGSGFNYAGAGAAALGAGMKIKRIMSSDADSYTKAKQIREAAAIGVADYFTGGLASLLEAYAKSHWAGTLNKISKFDDKWNPDSRILKFAVGTKKDKDQVQRDRVRKVFSKTGFTDNNHLLTLADGSKYDLGVDGKAKLKNVDGSERHAYDVDFGDKRAGDIVADLDPLGYLISHGKEKVRTDTVGELTNAALSSGDPLANVRQIYTNAKIQPDQIRNLLNQDKELDPKLRDVYLNSLNRVFAPAPQHSRQRTSNHANRKR